MLIHVPLSPTVQKWLFLGFFIAFAIKAPLWPFHTWLPDAAAASPPGAAVLLVGVLDKVGTFGMLRYCFELFPAGAKYFTPLVITLAVIGILYGAIVAIGQADMKRLIAYTSISHFGFIALGIFAMTTQGVTGATFYMVNHGFATGALFILAGFLIVRRGTDRIADFGGVQKVAPLLAGLFLVSGLAGLSLPGLSTFVSEFLVLIGTFSRYKLPAIIATSAIILAAIYILWMYQRTMTGPVRDEVAGMKDLRPRELLAVAPLVVLLIAGGRLSQAGARHHQPRGPGDDDAGARDRSGARPSRPRVYDDRRFDQHSAEGNRTVTGVLAVPVALAAPAAHAALAGSASSVTGAIRPPSIEYGQLAPMLIVFVAAVVGVLVEAFAPRSARRAVQLVLTLGSLAAAFILTIVVAANSTSSPTAARATSPRWARSRSTGPPCSSRAPSWCSPS